MKRLLYLFFDILLLRAGPQDVPPSRALLGLTLAASAATSALLAQATLPGSTALARAALELGLTAALLAMLLRLSGRAARFRQSFIAICGTGAILALFAWPLFNVVLGRSAGDDMVALAMLVLWGLYGWSVVVLGHILRHAMDTGLARGVLLALIYVLLIAGIGEWVIPTRPGTA